MKKHLSNLYIGLVFAFLYAPILVLIIFSFNESKSRGVWSGFSLKWYQALFQDQLMMDALYTTLLIAILSATIATILGTIAATAIHGIGKYPKLIINQITYLPMMNPDIVTGVALMLFFLLIQLELGFATLLLSHVIFNTSYVIFMILPKLAQLNKNTVEAALDLGASPLYAYLHVVLPQIKEGIFTGFLFAFTLSLDDFVISFFTTGNGVNNLAIVIYTMAKRGLNPKINAMLTIVFVLVIMLLVLVNLRNVQKDKKNKNTTSFRA